MDTASPRLRRGRRAALASLLPALAVLAACRPPAAGWGRVEVRESRLGTASWSVLVDDRGQGVELQVDGAAQDAQCRRTSAGIRCWVAGLRAGFRRLAVQVGGRGTARRTALSGPPEAPDLVIYELVLDRFADGDLGNNVRVDRADPAAPHGGDLAGLRGRLSFLKALGVNAILISPPWDHVRVGRGPDGEPAWVGRRPRSLAAAERLSPAFGSPATLMHLLSGARRQGIRVLLDLPRPAGWPVGRYFEVVRGWVSRTFVDGVRLGVPASGELGAWARETRALADAFSPLVLVHRPGGQGAALEAALSGAPASARVIEEEATGEALLAWLGCPGARASAGASGGGAGPGGSPGTPPDLPRALRAGGGPRARILSGISRPGVSARCLAPGRGAVAAEEAEKAAATALTAHLLFAEIPVVFYADGLDGIGPGASLPDLDRAAESRSVRHRLIRKVVALRRAVPALRRGTQRLRADGDVLLVSREHRGCRVLVAIHRGERSRRLTVSLRELGWPAAGPDAEATLELVERLGGRGVAAEKGLVTLELAPRSVSVLVPAGQDACRG